MPKTIDNSFSFLYYISVKRKEQHRTPPQTFFFSFILLIMTDTEILFEHMISTKDIRNVEAKNGAYGFTISYKLNGKNTVLAGYFTKEFVLKLNLYISNLKIRKSGY